MDHLRPVNNANSNVLLIGRRKEEEKYVLFVMTSSRDKIPNKLVITTSIPLDLCVCYLEAEVED